jgi:hypothetical protein
MPHAFPLRRALVVGCALFGTLDAALLAAQTPKSLGRPQAEFPEPFTALRAVHELPDGRLLVIDPRDKIVQTLDLKTGRSAAVAREGSGPNEYGLPLRLLPVAGDSALVADILNARFLVVGPDGRPAGTWSPAADRAAAPAGGGRTVMMAGPGLVAQVAGSDARGRLYSTGREITMGPDGPRSADSVPLLRLDRARNRTDTLAWLARDPQNMSVSGGSGNMNVRIGRAPFPFNDAFTVFPDGRIAIVRAQGYRVDVVTADGRLVSGPRIAYTPVKVDGAVKQRWRDAQRGQTAIMITQSEGVRAGASRNVTAGAAQVQDPDSWPDVLPPFGSGVYAMPGGALWVQRYEGGNATGTLFDVFDAAGRRTGQVRVPEGVRIVGGGENAVYAVRVDEDDLQYLQRYAVP